MYLFNIVLLVAILFARRKSRFTSDDI